jgi:hypothetical protein
MNIVEEYILRKNGLIILITGLSGTKKSQLAKEIERDFKVLKLLCLDDYCDENKVPIIEFFDQKIKDWDDIEVYDWEKFNSDVNKYKKSGCLIYGDIIPKTKINFDPDFHIHITISKDKLVEKRREFIEKNPEKCQDMMVFLDKLNVFINKITYSHYIKNRSESKIDLWLKSDENTLDEMYDQTFNYIIDKLNEFLNGYYSIHERKFDFVKDKNNDSKRVTYSEDNSDSDDSEDDSEDSEDYSEDDSEEDSENTEPMYDEVEKVYRDENKDNVSLGRYRDLKMELELSN